MAASDLSHIAAIVLAAGLSSRMGATKALLPWLNNQSVLEHILDQLQKADLTNILVVTGHQAYEIELVARNFNPRFVHNPDYANGEMLLSMQVGLRALPQSVSAALIVLGDQPQIQAPIVSQILLAHRDHPAPIIIPSFEMRRGHPMLLEQQLWSEILALPVGAVAREVINRYAAEIHYVTVENDSILRDMDTPREYADELRHVGLE